MSNHLNGFFAIGIYHTKSSVNVGTLIRSAVAFGASYVFTIGKRYKKQSSSVKTDRHIPIHHYADLDDWKAHLPFNGRVVLVELDDNATPIIEFKHPKNAIYLLGAEDNGLPLNQLQDFPVVQLPGCYCLNVATAGSIIMYDRISKNGVVE